MDGSAAYSHGTNLSVLLKCYFNKYVGVDIGVQKYHSMCAAVSCDLAIAHLDDVDEVTEGLQGQMGHSQAIADAHYGLEPGDTAGDNARTHKVYERASQIWHGRFLGLTRALEAINEPKDVTETMLEQVVAKIDSLGSRLDAMEVKTDAKFASLDSKMEWLTQKIDQLVNILARNVSK
jgi:hypothetical protein